MEEMRVGRSEPMSSSGDWERRLLQAHQGSVEIRTRLLEEYRSYLLQLARQELDTELRAKVGASDLVQESLVAAYCHFDQFHGDRPEELKGWLKQILLNRLANWRRYYRDTDKRQLDCEVPLDPAWQSDVDDNWLTDNAPSPSAVAIHNEQQRLLQQALARLPEQYRQVLVWRSLEQRSFDEIGGLLGRSP